MNELLKIFLKAMLVDNVILVQYLALCPFMGMTSDTGKSAGMGIATSFVILLATAATYPIYYCVLVPLKLQFLQTLIFILVIASLVQLVEFYLKKSSPALYSAMGVYLRPVNRLRFGKRGRLFAFDGNHGGNPRAPENVENAWLPKGKRGPLFGNVALGAFVHGL